MTVKIEIQNFQSIKRAELEVKGLTAITGPNNSGKSAVMRATKGAFQNTKGSSFVRKGSQKTSVFLSFEDGKSLSWEKNAGKSTKPAYIIDGGDPINPGQSVPEELDSFRVASIQAGGRDIWPQFAPQFSGQVFLLDEPGSVLAEAVADVDRVSILTQAQKSAESDQRAANNELKVRSKDLKKLEEEMGFFEGLDEAETLIVAIEESYKRLSKMSFAIQKVKSLRDQLKNAQELVDHLSGVKNIIVPEESQLQEIREGIQQHSSLSSLHGKFSRVTTQIKKLSGIQKVHLPEESVTQQIREGIQQHSSLVYLQGKFSRVSSEIKSLSGIPEISIDLGPVKKVQKVLSMALDLQRRLGAEKAQVEAQEKNLHEKQKEAKKAQEDFEQELQEIGECPLCGSDTKGQCHTSLSE